MHILKKGRSLLLMATIAGNIFSYSSQAQQKTRNIQLDWGETYRFPKKHAEVTFLGDNTDGYVEVGHRPHRSLSFQRFDNTLQIKKETLVDLGTLPDDYCNELFIKLNGKYYWLFSTWERSDETERLFVQQLDLQEGQPVGKAEEVASTSKIAGGMSTESNSGRPVMFWNMWNNPDGKWNFVFSADTSAMLVHYRKKPESRRDSKNKDVIGFQVFDKNMHKIWGKEIRMPYTEDVMDNEDYQVDSKGNVYVLARVFDGSRNAKRPQSRFEILKWAPGQEEATIIPFKFTDRFVTDVTIKEDRHHNMVVAGYYSTRKATQGGFNPFSSTAPSVDGAFILKINPETNNLDDVLKGTYEFPSSVLKEYESKRTRKRIDRKSGKGDVEASDIVLRNVEIGDDGSIQIYGEEKYTITTTYMNGRSVRTVVTFYYQDILGMSISPEGKLNWVKKIPKNQRGRRGMSGMSYRLFRSNNTDYLFFMDNIKNLNLSVNQAPAEHFDGAGGVLMVVKIDQNGAMSKAKVLDIREERVTFNIANMRQVGPDQVIVRARGKKGKGQIARITL